jgi:cell shape-determining protein MreC
METIIENGMKVEIEINKTAKTLEYKIYKNNEIVKSVIMPIEFENYKFDTFKENITTEIKQDMKKMNEYIANKAKSKSIKQEKIKQLQETKKQLKDLYKTKNLEQKVDMIAKIVGLV